MGRVDGVTRPKMRLFYARKAQKKTRFSGGASLGGRIRFTTHTIAGLPSISGCRGLRPSGQPARNRLLQVLLAVLHGIGDIALGTDDVNLPLMEMKRRRALAFAQDTAVQPCLLDLLAGLDSGNLELGGHCVGLGIQPLLQIFDFFLNSVDHHFGFSCLFVERGHMTYFIIPVDARFCPQGSGRAGGNEDA